MDIGFHNMRRIVLSIGIGLSLGVVTPLYASVVSGPWTLRAVVDGYFTTLNPKQDSNTPYGFMYTYNTFEKPQLNYALGLIDYDTKNVYGELGLHTGRYVQSNYVAEPAVYKAIYSAFLGYRLTEKLSVDGGIFPSHIGMESAIGNDNRTLSRSLAADNTPYFESGLRVSYKPNSKWTATVLGLNGWQVIQKTNNNVAIGTQIQYRPFENLCINSSTYWADQDRFFHNAYVIYDVSTHWQWAADLDLGWQETPEKHHPNTWHAWFIQAGYKTHKKWAYAARIERYSDLSGVMGFPELQATGYSINADYQITNHILSRAEIKTLNLDSDPSAIIGIVSMIVEL